MIVLGFNILGNLNKSATSVQSLGLPLWRIVIASGILSSLMGLFNIIAVSNLSPLPKSFANNYLDLRIL